jgi:uncharacterized membrane protein (DUF485 family)
MKTDLLKHLWSSADVRNAVRKEALRLLVFMVLYIGFIALGRYTEERSIQEGISSASIGVAAFSLMWVLSVIRTIRSVLRENGLLDP